jgi:hypothetical protein
MARIMDAIYMGITLFFFILSLGLVKLCEKLQEA